MSSIHDALRRSDQTLGTQLQFQPPRRPASKWRRWSYILALTVMIAATVTAVLWFLGWVLHPGGGYKSVVRGWINRAEVEAMRYTGPPEPVNVEIRYSTPGGISVNTPVSQPAEETQSNKLPAGPQSPPLEGSPAWPGREAAAENTPPILPEPPQVPTMEEPVSEQPGAMDHFEEARLAHDRGDLDLAIHHYRRALDLDANLAGAYLNLGNIYLFDRDQPELARDMFEHVLNLEPDNKLAYNNLGVLNMREGRLAEAEKYLATALEKDPTFVDAVYNLACLNARQGRNSLAMSYLKKAARITPDAAVWAREDEDLKSLRDQPEFQRFLNEAPEKADPYKDNADG